MRQSPILIQQKVKLTWWTKLCDSSPQKEKQELVTALFYNMLDIVASNSFLLHCEKCPQFYGKYKKFAGCDFIKMLTQELLPKNIELKNSV